MKTIIKFLNKWGVTIFMCILLIPFICALICNLSMIFTHYALLVSIPGTIGATISLVIGIYLLISEIKETLNNGRNNWYI